MAKAGARIAWPPRNGLQIHGGNGFAWNTKLSRFYAIARILKSLKVPPKSQAQVIRASSVISHNSRH